MAALIDLHLHTTASDGRCTPEQLVERVAQAGIGVFSVTDHDTRAGVAAAEAAAARLGLTCIAGIEITSVHAGKDVHVLAYGLPAEIPELDALISTQRQARIERAREIAERLAKLGAPIAVDQLMADALNASGKAVARPRIAEYLVAAGHVSSVAEAFERYLGEDSPAYVPHQGAPPASVVALIARAGGLSSLAHPGYTKRDELLPGLVDAGLMCIEAFHSSHDAAAERHYLDMAAHHELAVTGGSDYHGEGTRRAEFFGVTNLPSIHYERFKALLARHTTTIANA